MRQYNADIESISDLLKGGDMKRTSRRTVLLKGGDMKANRADNRQKYEDNSAAIKASK